MTSPTQTSPPQLPINTALRFYWKYMIGIAAFPPVFIVGSVFVSIPHSLMIPCFYGVTFLAGWPYLRKRAPYTFWIIAMAVWMSSGILSMMILMLLSLLGIQTE